MFFVWINELLLQSRNPLSSWLLLVPLELLYGLFSYLDSLVWLKMKSKYMNCIFFCFSNIWIVLHLKKTMQFIYFVFVFLKYQTTISGNSLSACRGKAAYTWPDQTTICFIDVFVGSRKLNQGTNVMLANWRVQNIKCVDALLYPATIWVLSQWLLPSRFLVDLIFHVNSSAIVQNFDSPPMKCACVKINHHLCPHGSFVLHWTSIVSEVSKSYRWSEARGIEV